MSNFTKTIKRNYDFEGDNVIVVMNRLKRKHALKLIPLMGEPDENGQVKMDLNDSFEFMNAAATMLTDYIITMSGLVDESGNELSKEDAFGSESESYFIQLASDIMSDLMEASFINSDNEKKSEGQHKNILVGTAIQTNSVSEG